MKKWINKSGGFLLGVCLVMIMAIPRLAQAAVPQDITGASVIIFDSASSSSLVTLVWDSVSPVNGGSVSYDIEKSIDGGLTYSLVVNTDNTSWTDTNGGNGIKNYTNVIYCLKVKETKGQIIYYSPNGKFVNVFPPDINAHDNYERNSDLCHYCHSTHSGQADEILSQSTATAICLTCHSGLTNSKYDVINGYTRVSGGNAKSLGGAFAHQGVAGDVWNGASTTSAHTVDEESLVAAPGGINMNQTMGCTTCHSGHATGNYRLLKRSISVPAGEDLLTTFDLDITAGAATENESAGEVPVYITGIELLCESCHSDYAVPAGSGGSGSILPVLSNYDTPGAYRHPVDISPSSKDLTTTLPLEGRARDNTDKMICLTCHYAHGTVAQDMTVSTVVSGDGTWQSVMSSALKRMDGMMICEDCHNK